MKKYQVLDSDKTIYLVGLNFNTKQRNIDEFILEKLE